jgi:hypothetical protein
LAKVSLVENKINLFEIFFRPKLRKRPENDVKGGKDF